MSAKYTLTIPAEAREVLQKATVTGDIAKLPDQQLPRPQYLAVARVLKELGGTWDRRSASFLLPPGKGKELLEALQVGEVRREKVVRQAFYTPEAAADRLVAAVLRLHGRRRIHTVLEPSVGEGALYFALLRALKAAWRPAPKKVYLVDVAPPTEALRALVSPTPLLHQGSYLEWAPPELVDLILMNPPYTRSQARDHVTHALQHLAPGGTLGVILPPNTKGIPGEYASEPLPKGSFRTAGTEIETEVRVYRRATACKP